MTDDNTTPDGDHIHLDEDGSGYATIGPGAGDWDQLPIEVRNQMLMGLIGSLDPGVQVVSNPGLRQVGLMLGNDGPVIGFDLETARLLGERLVEYVDDIVNGVNRDEYENVSIGGEGIDSIALIEGKDSEDSEGVLARFIRQLSGNRDD